MITVDLAVGDRLLFCSDGLTTMLRDDAIADVLRSEANRGRAAGELIEAANDAGGSDNITVLLIDVVDDDATVELAPPATEPEAQEAEPEEQEPEPEPEPATAEEAEPEAATTETAVPEPEPEPKRRWWQRRHRS